MLSTECFTLRSEQLALKGFGIRYVALPREGWSGERLSPSDILLLKHVYVVDPMRAAAYVDTLAQRMTHSELERRGRRP